LTAPKQAWLINKQIGGFKTEYGKFLTFATGINVLKNIFK